MKALLHLICISCFTMSLNLASATETEKATSVTWEINSLDSIGGYPVTYSGDPQVISTEIGDAVEFDGDGDRLLVHNNPIGSSKKFTVEAYFKPADAFAISEQPRFIHIQDTNDPVEKRVMMELRLTESGEWYLDGFMKTDANDLTLIDDTKKHSTEEWMHAAITYANGFFKTYVNGTLELSGTINFTSDIVNEVGVTSIGSRMNRVRWYAGIIKTLKVTDDALVPGQFLIDETTYNRPKSAEISLRTFPNPAKDFVNVRFTLTSQSMVEVAVFNLLGSKVESIFTEAIIGENSTVINTNHLPNGLYMVSLIVNGDTFTKKIRIQP